VKTDTGAGQHRLASLVAELETGRREDWRHTLYNYPLWRVRLLAQTPLAHGLSHCSESWRKVAWSAAALALIAPPVAAALNRLRSLHAEVP
jgi:hypothetical protein